MLLQVQVLLRERALQVLLRELPQLQVLQVQELLREQVLLQLRVQELLQLPVLLQVRQMPYHIHHRMLRHRGFLYRN